MAAAGPLVRACPYHIVVLSPLSVFRASSETVRVPAPCYRSDNVPVAFAFRLHSAVAALIPPFSDARDVLLRIPPLRRQPPILTTSRLVGFYDFLASTTIRRTCSSMRRFAGTALVLFAISDALLAAVLSDINREVEEHLIISRFRGVTPHDHRTDPGYAGILSDSNDIDSIKHSEPSKIKARIFNILEKMDHNKDGYIDKKELTDKLMESYRKLSASESDSEFETSDLDENGFITWDEYLGDAYMELEFRDDRTLFYAADIDNDGKLNQLEFRYYYTPEDYPQMKPAVMVGVMRQYDSNKDGKITFDEFLDYRKKGLTEEEMEQENYKFTLELDTDKNGVLDEEEVYQWFLPMNNMSAESEAENLLFKADKNRDGTLSFNEILEGYKYFISPDSEGHYIFKDEL
ncbi:calumenin-B-like isoform X2 [Sipha flava]|uniref:Calumenin-B-like isoform X2 n=1 Tax=Sipha flava TaxID=143950 RepID=A0A8B8G3G3_9HEMI|nr:calumenin-B-like isoform X2 [Sipha flava]